MLRELYVTNDTLPESTDRMKTEIFLRVLKVFDLREYDNVYYDNVLYSNAIRFVWIWIFFPETKCSSYVSWFSHLFVTYFCQYQKNLLYEQTLKIIFVIHL
jgi:hypothetical protein